MIRRCAAMLVAALIPPAAAIAQSEPPQVARQNLMEQNGDATKLVGDMLKGVRPYDAAAATSALSGISADIRMFVTLFPEGTETGYKTRALPAIWTDRAGFDAAGQKLDAAATAASAATASAETLGPAFGAVGQACRGCHEEFRAPDE